MTTPDEEWVLVQRMTMLDEGLVLDPRFAAWLPASVKSEQGPVE